MKTNDQFDDILNQAMTEYRDAQPLGGLEDRVLRRVREHQVRRRSWMAWSLVAGLATALVVAVWLGTMSHSQPSRTEERSTAQQSRSSAMQATRQVSRAAPEQAKNRLAGNTTRPHSGPRTIVAHKNTGRDEFPLPTPLTPSERTLLAMARTDPRLLQWSPPDRADIVIAPIEIPPLEDTHAGDQGEN